MAYRKKGLIPPVGHGKEQDFMVSLLFLGLAVLLPVLLIALYQGKNVEIEASPVSSTYQR